MSEGKEIVLEFPLTGSDFNTAGEASSKIKRVLQQIGVPSEVVRRIAIGSYEAELNVIIHACSGIIRATVSPERTKLDVKDKGPGIPDISLAMQEGYSTAPDFVREMGFGAGMGLPNMRKCADSFDIRSKVGEGTEIVMVFHHKPV